MDSASLLTYLAAVLVLLVIPGPAILIITTRTVRGGTRAGLLTGAGVATGDLVHAGFAALGLSALLMTSASAFQVVKLAGAAYLLYLGVRAILEKPAEAHEDGPPFDGARLNYLQGLLSEVLNPKVALFFLAFLPQFVDPAGGGVTRQLALLGSIYVVLSVSFIILLVTVAGPLAARLRRSRRFNQWQGKVVGAVFIALAARVALQQR